MKLATNRTTSSTLPYACGYATLGN